MNITAQVSVKSIGGNILTKVLPVSAPEKHTDYFITKDGQTFAGVHLIVDLWDAVNLTDVNHVDQTLRSAARESGATILHSHMHHFSPDGGVSGVVLLAESHISIHTWPERNYAAVDIFMCGDCDPEKAIPILQNGFGPAKITVQNIRRGIVKREG